MYSVDESSPASGSRHTTHDPSSLNVTSRPSSVNAAATIRFDCTFITGAPLVPFRRRSFPDGSASVVSIAGVDQTRVAVDRHGSYGTVSVI